MKKYFIFSFLIFWCSISEALDIANPVLTAKAVIENTESYLTKEKSILLEKYELAFIRFNYYSPQDKTTGTWILSYRCKPVNGIHVTDCGFTVRVSNTPKPIFEFIPINV